MSNTQITTFTPNEMPAEELALAVREYQLAKLPPENRVAIQIGEADIIARGDALLTEASQITAVTDKATRAQAHATGQALIKLRTEVERKAKALRDDSNAHSKACIAAEKRLVARTKPAEDAVILLRDQFDAAEKARKDGHESAIRAISARAIPPPPPSMPSNELQAAIDATRSDLAGREWEEYAKQAKAAADAALVVLDVTLALAVAREEAEAKARAEAERAEAERLAREAAEREEREAAEREAARVAGLKARLIDLELSIARQIRSAANLAAAQKLVDAMVPRWAGYWDAEAASWGEFADDAADVIEAGHADAMAHLERLQAAAADRASREAAERDAAALAQKIATEQAAREAEEQAAAEAQAKAAEEARLREVAAEQAAIAAEAVVDGPAPPPASEPIGIRWRELCSTMGCEIPPWVLEQMGCAPSDWPGQTYGRDALQALADSLGAIRGRVVGLIK